jgi:plasmid maintenance system antidote protein VapI
MITNKSDSADTSEKFVTPREKKIGDLAQVLERQRQTIKTLLTSKKEENIKRDHNVYMQIQNKPKF